MPTSGERLDPGQQQALVMADVEHALQGGAGLVVPSPSAQGATEQQSSLRRVGDQALAVQHVQHPVHVQHGRPGELLVQLERGNLDLGQRSAHLITRLGTPG